MATHSSILAWKTPWTEEPGGLVHGVAKSWARLSIHAHIPMYEEVSGRYTPCLQWGHRIAE